MAIFFGLTKDPAKYKGHNFGANSKIDNKKVQFFVAYSITMMLYDEIEKHYDHINTLSRIYRSIPNPII